MKLPSRDDIQRIRERYPAGTRVELIRMNDGSLRGKAKAHRGMGMHARRIAIVSEAVPHMGAVFSLPADLQAVGHTLPCVGRCAFL